MKKSRRQLIKERHFEREKSHLNNFFLILLFFFLLQNLFKLNIIFLTNLMPTEKRKKKRTTVNAIFLTFTTCLNRSNKLHFFFLLCSRTVPRAGKKNYNIEKWITASCRCECVYVLETRWNDCRAQAQNENEKKNKIYTTNISKTNFSIRLKFIPFLFMLNFCVSEVGVQSYTGCDCKKSTNKNEKKKNREKLI